MVSIRVSLVIRNTNFSSNRQYSCHSFETVFDLSLFELTMAGNYNSFIFMQLSVDVTTGSHNALEVFCYMIS